MKFVVTGGAGFFGSILRDYLVEQGHDVLSVDLLAHGQDSRSKYQAAQIDITDLDKFQKRLQEFAGGAGIDCIFHVAALLAHVKEHR
ncbi:MAG TPA: NAD-dependent epimerase/dehydratase family protein, partial [Chroococcales cyanobacterium]